MGQLIVGDVHGCYYTLKELLREHWRPEEDTLILIGDIINKGPHSAKALKYAIKLKRLHPFQVILLRGNHEQWFLESYRHKSKSKAYSSLLDDLNKQGLKSEEVNSALSAWPLHWESNKLFVSHAGLSNAAVDPFDPRDEHGLLKNRKNLKPLSKIQIIGHNIIDLGKPLFKPQENAWYLDTGAWCHQKLSALHFQDGSSVPKVLQVDRKSKDNA